MKNARLHEEYDSELANFNIDAISRRSVKTKVDPFDEYLMEVNNHLYKGTLNFSVLDNIGSTYRFAFTEQHKRAGMDLIIQFVELTLWDRRLEPKEMTQIKLLKQVFAIKPGDFLITRYDAVKNLVDEQVASMLASDEISNSDALELTDVQTLFDLSYDQLILLSKDAVSSALDRGVDPDDISYLLD